MADIYARQNGNWSSTSTWDGGVIPTIGDNVYANNRSITIDVNAHVNSITDFPGLSTAGGIFYLSNGVSLTATINAGGASANYMLQFNGVTPNRCFIYGNITNRNVLVGVVYAIQNGSTGTMNIIGNLSSGFDAIGQNYGRTGAINNNSSGTINIIGDVNGISSFQAFGVNNNSSGTINITGRCIGAAGFARNNAGLGNNSGIVNVFGQCLGFNGGMGAWNYGSGTINVYGDVYGGRGLDSGDKTHSGIHNSSTGVVRVYGNSYGSLSGAFPGVTNTSTGSAFVYGTSFGGRDIGSHGILNTGVGGCIYTKQAVGNGWGVGSYGAPNSPAYGPAYGIVNSAGGVANCFVEQLICGIRGMFPSAGFVYLSASPDNIIIGRNINGGSVSLYRPGFGSTFTPSVSDVRINTPYAEGARIGTLAMPLTSLVNFSVPVDNGVGGAVFDSNTVFSVVSRNIRENGSIGQRVSQIITSSQIEKLINNLG